MVRDPILRNTSMENVVTVKGSNFAALSHTYQQQSPMGQDQQSAVSRDRQFTPEIYSLPVSSQNEPVMDSNINNGGLGGTYSISTVTGFSQPTTPLSTSTSFQSDNFRLTPNELGVNMQLDGGSGEGGLREQQQLHSQASSATGYSGAPAYHKGKYSTALQPDVYSLHPSRSNSRQVSPKQWHAEAQFLAEHVVVPPQQQPVEAMPSQVIVQQVAVPRQPSLDPMTAPKQVSIPSLNEQDGEHLIIVDASKPPGVAYQAAVEYQVAEMQATTPALTNDQQARFESRPLQPSVYKHEVRQAPYQPRTQYLPASASITVSASALPLASPSRSKLIALLPLTATVAGGEPYANPNYMQLTQPVPALGAAPIGLTTAVSPPPIPGRPWSQVPPVTFSTIPASVFAIDQQAGVPLSSGAHYQSQSSYFGVAEQVPTSQRGVDDVAAVAMTLRAHQETVVRQKGPARRQEELARRKESLARQEAIARQEATALAQQQQEALTMQEAVVSQEARARQEALAQPEQQLQDSATRFFGVTVGGGPGASFGSTLEIRVISPPPSQPVLQNSGSARGFSDQELAEGGGAYRLNSRGHGKQEIEVEVGVGGQTTTGGSSLVVPPEATSDLAEAVRSIQSSPIGSAAATPDDATTCVGTGAT
ncbi:hypothetical protein BGZ47_007903 [Haplosporangium gracile]|nr:hypothetical protein BGZ47_007903 [Haplosporangium gracile]